MKWLEFSFSRRSDFGLLRKFSYSRLMMKMWIVDANKKKRSDKSRKSNENLSFHSFRCLSCSFLIRIRENKCFSNIESFPFVFRFLPIVRSSHKGKKDDNEWKRRIFTRILMVENYWNFREKSWFFILIRDRRQSCTTTKLFQFSDIEIFLENHKSEFSGAHENSLKLFCARFEFSFPTSQLQVNNW